MTQTNPEQWAVELLNNILNEWRSHGIIHACTMLEAAFADREENAGFERDILATRTDATPVDWMPIESAPKDGRSVLVWRDDWGEPVIARWACCYDFLTNAEIAESGLDDEALAKCDWFAADFMQGCRLENDTAPTHWMPFPAPPDATNTHPPATDVAALVDAARDALPFMTQLRAGICLKTDGKIVSADSAYQNLSAALAPFTKGQNDEH